MINPSYHIDRLAFAYRCHAYFRWHTHWRARFPILRELAREKIQEIYPEIHIAEFRASDQEVVLLAKLRPAESIASAAAKLKRAISRVARSMLNRQNSTKIFGRGYFAATVGSRTRSELDRYLDEQCQHHGYDRRYDPVWVQTWSEPSNDGWLQSPNSRTFIGWHLVFCTWDRVPVFGRTIGESFARLIHGRSADLQAYLRKISVVPDHVHMAFRAHPSVAPGELASALLMPMENIVYGQHRGALFGVSIPQLWKPSAYTGSYGELSGGQLRTYIRNWTEPQPS